MESRASFFGTWVSSLPFKSDDYLVEYKIWGDDQSIFIEAKDLQDGEKMDISDIKFGDAYLEFVSVMPSTKRKGVNRLKLIDANSIESEFTFTVVEHLKKIK